MTWGSFRLGVLLLVLAIIVGTFSNMIPTLFGGPPAAPGTLEMTVSERFTHVGMMFGPLPDWVKSWMTFQHYVFAGSLLFVLWHKEAQIYLLGIVASHALSFSEIAFLPVGWLGLDLVALNHWLWIPAWWVLLKKCRLFEFKNGYDFWCIIALFQLSFSLIFDLRDGAQFFLRMFGGG